MPYAESPGWPYPNCFNNSAARSRNTSGDFSSGTLRNNIRSREKKQRSVVSTMAATSNDAATAGRNPPCFGAAATISGDGVSPAASAAASGSPPGKAAATCNADAGRFAESRSRQRKMTGSMSGSSSGTSSPRLVGVLSLRRSRSNSGNVDASKARLPVNTS